MANGLHHFSSHHFESDSLNTLQFGSVLSFTLIEGKAMESPVTVSTADWSIRPADHNVLWAAGATISPTYLMTVKTMESTSGSSSKITGSLLASVSGTIPPDLPILGRGGSYEITFGMYSAPALGGGSISTAGLITKTLIQGKSMAPSA